MRKFFQSLGLFDVADWLCMIGFAAVVAALAIIVIDSVA